MLLQEGRERSCSLFWWTHKRVSQNWVLLCGFLPPLHHPALTYTPGLPYLLPPLPLRTKPEEPVPLCRLTLLQGPEGTNSPHSGPEQPRLGLPFHLAPGHHFTSARSCQPQQSSLSTSAARTGPWAITARLTMLLGRGGRRALAVMPCRTLNLGHNSSSNIFPVLQINFSDAFFKWEPTLCWGFLQSPQGLF